ncbi:hypothetical protein MNBD_NITROSPINAE03-1417 [hydrothermal vent metagenome]|uniref:Uncharacterized protein n=1 Tax=hydrothermal vent metagenome TaxID=652676 RepID=A0A3B1BMN3_9ZZZZ
MRHKTKKMVNKQKRAPTKRVSTSSAIADKSRCNHCGGLLRLLPEEASCINCGREANHQCDACLYGRQDVVA